MGHNLWRHDSTALDVATIILNQSEYHDCPGARQLVSRSQTLSQGKGGGGRGGRESGKVLYIELSQRLV